MLGGGDAAGAEARLLARVQELDHPAYVVVAELPDELAKGEDAESLATLLAADLGPGLYVVIGDDASSGIVLRDVDLGPGVQPRAFTSAARDAVVKLMHAGPRDDHGYVGLTPTAEAETVLAVAATGGQAPSDAVFDELASPSTTYPNREPVPLRSEWSATTSELALTAALIGTAVLLATRRLLTWWPARESRSAERRSGALPEATELRPVLERELHRLGRAVAAIGPEPVDADAANRAVAAREAAEQLLGDDDAAELLGALVLVRTGRADALLAVGGEKVRRYRCCFFHPMHGEGTESVSWETDGTAVDVPACSRCAADVRTGRDPEVLVPVRRGRRDRPYYELDDVWARTGYGSLVDDLAVRVLRTRAGR
jgi:hypothetical protein